MPGEAIPTLMHFPAAAYLARRGYSIRRIGWNGAPGAHEAAWLRYVGGLWFYRTAAGERVAESGDVTAEDMLALDWTVIGLDCDPQEHPSGTRADAVIFGVRPFDLTDEPESPSGQLADPNGLLGQSVCGGGVLAPSLPLTPPLSPGAPGQGSGGGSVGQVSGGNAGAPVAPPVPPVNPLRSSGSGGGGGSGGGTGGGRRRRKRRNDTPPMVPTVVLTLDTFGQAVTNDCTEREVDECGRGCGDVPAYDLEYTYGGATIALGADDEEPGSIWSYLYYFRGNQAAQGTIQAGASIDVDVVANRTVEIAVGAMHQARVVVYRGGRSVEGTDAVSCPDFCPPDPECGQPCGGSGSGSGSGSETVTITANSGSGGTTTGSGVYNIGEGVSLSAYANGGYAFYGWWAGGTMVTLDSPWYFTASVDLTVEAQFVPSP